MPDDALELRRHVRIGRTDRRHVLLENRGAHLEGRVAVKRQAAYVWAQHFFNGRDAGLTDEEIARLAYGPDAPFFAPLDAATIRAVDELIDDGVIGDDTWATLSEELDEQQLFDLIFTVGCYETIVFSCVRSASRSTRRSPTCSPDEG
jgi:hypothetical protein